jgi:hypothetical protein
VLEGLLILAFEGIEYFAACLPTPPRTRSVFDARNWVAYSLHTVLGKVDGLLLHACMQQQNHTADINDVSP